MNNKEREESEWDETVIFDREHLKNFTSGDPFFEKQILDIFIENAPSYLVALFSCTPSDWSAHAHKLKGAARGIGAWKLARAAERAEMMHIEEHRMFAEMKAELQLRMDELQAHLTAMPLDGDGLLL